MLIIRSILVITTAVKRRACLYDLNNLFCFLLCNQLIVNIDYWSIIYLKDIRFQPCHNYRFISEPNSISVELSSIDEVLFWVLTFGWLSWAIAIDVSPIAKFHSCYFSYQSIQHSSRLQQSQWSTQSNFRLHLHLLQLHIWLFISHSCSNILLSAIYRQT